MTQPVRNGGNRRSLSPGLMVVVALCLAAPFVALCWVGSYAKVDPKLAGFPFFFWYQLLWVPLAAILTYVAYRVLESGRRGRGPAGTGTGTASSDAAGPGGDSGEEAS